MGAQLPAPAGFLLVARYSLDGRPVTPAELSAGLAWPPERCSCAPGLGYTCPADTPELTPQAAIDRSWTVPPGRALMEPRQPDYLPTTPPHWWFGGPPVLPWDGTASIRS